jgi:hypothetical protein
MTCRKNEHGQAVVLMVISLAMLIGMCALVLTSAAGSARSGSFRPRRTRPPWRRAGAAGGWSTRNLLPSTSPTRTEAESFPPASPQHDAGVWRHDFGQRTKDQAGNFSKMLGINSVSIHATASAMRGSFTGWALGLAPGSSTSRACSSGKSSPSRRPATRPRLELRWVDLPVKEKGCDYASGGNDYYDLIAMRDHSCLVTVTQSLPVEPGNKAATGTAVKDRGAKQNFDPYSILTTYANGSTEITNYNSPNVIVIPVIKAFHQGSSTPFTVTGFAWFIITSWTNKEVTGMFVRSGAPSDSLCPTESDPNARCPFGGYNPDGFAVVKLIK